MRAGVQAHPLSGYLTDSLQISHDWGCWNSTLTCPLVSITFIDRLCAS
jgi:hypothetical protein